MSDQKKKNLIILVTCMIICVVLTSLLLTNSVVCRGCDKKITGKYFNDGGFSDTTFYCKECAIDYYGPFFKNDMALKVNNTLRNILVIIEILGFGAAIVVMNKGGIKEVKKFVPVSRPISGTTPIKEKPPVSDPKPVVEPRPVVTPVPTPDSVEKTIPEDGGRLKTTFKPISESRIEAEPPSSTVSFEPSSASQSNDDRFKPAGDL
ncbi:MAG: hypothetical protein IKA17_04950 [Clostridia bacterium]|nr:hypothetical protein [Clostridia bacterium]